MKRKQLRAEEIEFIESRPINIPPELIRQVNADCLRLMERRLRELWEFNTARDQIDPTFP